MYYPTKQKKIDEILKFIYDGKTINQTLLEINASDFATIIESATKLGYITGANIIQTKDYPIIETEKIELTELGAEKINPTKPVEKTSQTTNNFNFNSAADYRGSTFGSENTINNEWVSSLEELREYIETLSPEDQKTGEEIIEIVEKRDFPPNILNRFYKFLEKHPEIGSIIGKLVVGTLTNQE